AQGAYHQEPEGLRPDLPEDRPGLRGDAGLLRRALAEQRDRGRLAQRDPPRDPGDRGRDGGGAPLLSGDRAPRRSGVGPRLHRTAQGYRGERIPGGRRLYGPRDQLDAGLLAADYGDRGLGGGGEARLCDPGPRRGEPRLPREREGRGGVRGGAKGE